MKTAGIALTDAEQGIVEEILRRHVPERDVWAFGSRTRPPCKLYSDLDLAIVGAEPLSLETLGNMKDDFSESDLPYRVDLVDWARTSETFRQIIENSYIPIQRRA